MSAFRPGWLPSLLVALLLPGLLWLGFWQLQRGDEKRQLLASFEARRQAEPISLDQLEPLRDPAYRRVQLHGYFDSEHSLLLDNRIRDGHAGVELLQPFYDQPSGLWVLLNRGWLPWPDRRTPPRFASPDGVMQLKAWVYVAPAGGLHLQSGATEGWPRLITQVEASDLWQRLGRGGLPFEVRLEPGPASYRVDWPIVSMSPSKHVGYAVQWFALAAALLGLFIYLGIHNAREIRHEPSHRHA
ncbi:SURF1 family protein [Ectopseudomonas khazarica]|uniref:SURF1 family protein n=1 Tax=Ectopseudomonas khazarica TaxID=2502979 RepID=UPI001AEF6D21|nr:SURF1 family protein [Pseudomonas khazarica]QTS86690.1 SURF1 family protein [Pseudomonas khazarica]